MWHKYLAPAGRHVYSTPINKYTKAPEGRHVYPQGETQEEWMNQLW